MDKTGAERRKAKEVFPEGEQSESIHRIDRIQEQGFLRGKNFFLGWRGFGLPNSLNFVNSVEKPF